MSALIPTSTPCFPTLGETARKQPVRHQSPGWKILATLCCLATAAAAAQSGNFIYTDNGTDVTITGYVGKPAEPVGPITIPATILDPVSGLDDPVVSIGNSAFFNCSKLTTVALPASLTNIGTSAFGYCIALTSIPLPNGVTTIGNSAFGNCTALTSVTIPTGLITLGTSVFGNCTSLLTVTIPSNVTTIPQYTFFGCSGLTSVSLPATLTSIGANAFQSCIALTGVSIPPSVTTLRSKAFAGCKGLTSITIPASVATFETEVFRECRSLTSISVDGANSSFSSLDGVLFNKSQSTLLAFPPGRAGSYGLPQTVTSLGPLAFFTCDKLVGVTFPHVLDSIPTRAFSGCSKLINAVFMDDPPVSMSSNVFELSGPGFAIGYVKSGTGFTSPTWFGYTAYQIGAITPEFTWLYSNGVPGNSDFLSDANGDGVNLLMAYALNMDPNARNFLPQPVFAGNQMSLSFYANTPGVSYAVRTSDDMVNWSAEEVSLSGPVTNRTATVGFSGPRRFMRLEVSH